MTDVPDELVGRPGRSLFGIVRPAEVDAVLAELAAQGLEGQVLQPHDAETWRTGLQGGGLVGQAHRLFSEDGIEKGLRLSEQRADEAVIRVRARSAKAAEPAAAVLHARGGYFLHYFGDWTNTDMPQHRQSEFTESAATKASWGISTAPTDFMRRLPSFWRSSSLRLRVTSPP
jgi:hypothetical protein